MSFRSVAARLAALGFAARGPAAREGQSLVDAHGRASQLRETLGGLLWVFPLGQRTATDANALNQRAIAVRVVVDFAGQARAEAFLPAEADDATVDGWAAAVRRDLDGFTEG